MSAFRIPVYPNPEAWREAFRSGRSGESADVSGATRAIIDEVQRDGDDALRRFARRFDRVDVDSLRVTSSELQAAAKPLPVTQRSVLERALARITAFHERQSEPSFRLGAELEWRVLAIPSVGVYVPGGAAVYPSTVLMNVAPARVAGVPRIALATPPGALERHPALAAAILAAEVTEVYRVGGAQAIAAFALGTATIPRVRLVVGPGNAFVAEAKRQLSARVGIDSVAGPSEVVVVADASANARWVAADLLAQVEHGSGEELAVLITTSGELASATVDELERQGPSHPRRETISQALRARGAVILVRDLEQAVAVAEEIAPEHLEVMVEDPEALADRFPGAGAVLLGAHAPVALGDYGVGPNHVLPTGGAARYASPLSVADFRKRQALIRFDRPALLGVAAELAQFARMEGFEAHARSLEVRFDDE